MLEPFSQALVEIQNEIRDEFSWSEEEDLASTMAMLEMVEKFSFWERRHRLQNLEQLQKKLLADMRPIVLIGAAVEVEDLLSVLPAEPHLIAADGSVGILSEFEQDLWPTLALVVSDADGWPHLQVAAEKGITIALHAHGDNWPEVEIALAKWGEMSPTEPLPLILTHQTNSSIEGVYNVGGFTDGDRALCLMLALGIHPERLVLVGYDEQTFGRWSGVSNEALKRRKLAWMAKILDKVGFGNG